MGGGYELCLRESRPCFANIAQAEQLNKKKRGLEARLLPYDGHLNARSVRSDGKDNASMAVWPAGPLG